MKLFRQAAEIGKARRKADHIDAVIRRTMRGDESATLISFISAISVRSSPTSPP